MNMQPDFLKKKLGREGESRAAGFLKENGFRLLEQNYRCRLGEIDLIAEKDGELHFIEVKSRKSFKDVSPYELIPYPKQLHISKVAQYYWAKKKIKDQTGRFSLLIVDWEGERPSCEWVPDIFNSVYGY